MYAHIHYIFLKWREARYVIYAVGVSVLRHMTKHRRNCFYCITRYTRSNTSVRRSVNCVTTPIHSLANANRVAGLWCNAPLLPGVSWQCVTCTWMWILRLQSSAMLHLAVWYVHSNFAMNMLPTCLGKMAQKLWHISIYQTTRSHSTRIKC
jgi:hypothetical protein